MEFESLWMRSRKFRNIFMYNGIFPRIQEVNKVRAKEYWEARHPKIIWSFCGVPGCRGLVQEGEYCAKHSRSGLPTWNWSSGELYRLNTGFANGSSRLKYMNREVEYMHYRTHIATLAYGELPNGYVAYPRNGNPFDIHSNNIIILSKIAVGAVSTGMITLKEGILMDEILVEFLEEIFGSPRTQHQWLYTIADVAKLCKVRNARIRQAMSRDGLDLSDLNSVVDFCNAHVNSDTLAVDN